MPYLKERYIQTVKQTTEKIRSMVYKHVGDLATVCYKTPEPIPYDKRQTGERVELSIGDSWGKLFDCGWFNFTGMIPNDGSCSGKKIALVIDVNGEGLIFDEQGVPKRGLTCVESDFEYRLGMPGKRIYSFLEEASGGEGIDIWMDAGCNDLFGKYKGNGTLKEAHIAIVNDQAREIYYDLYVLINLLEALEPKSAQYNRILRELYDASLKLRSFSEAELEMFSQSVKALYIRGSEENYLKFTAIGHAHMDLAWLWPIRETHRKVARTFATVLDLMERYPEYKFGASQPQMYQWVKEDHPELFEKVKQKVKEGRWEIQGCMWVEADANLSGGEALVRQILYGKQFFLDEFGVDVKNLWLPDVFGYNAALPQILKKSGCEYFMTQKLSWSEHNKFPHQTFMWEGIDGSRIFTHMLPEETYNGPLFPKLIKFAEENYQDSGICDEALILFGIGDGGGGPGPEHLERLRRVENLHGICPVKNDFAEPMLERLKAKTEHRLETWRGELYLEKHQGTFTTQAKNKLYNRKMEFLLRELELALVISGADYDKAELDDIWKEVLLYQFHDIIPGSSIKRVHDESVARYELLCDKVSKWINSCYSSTIPNDQTAIYNALSWDYEGIVNIDGKDFWTKVPALGATTAVEGISEVHVWVDAQKRLLENDFLRAEFNSDGGLISLFDKENNRESLGIDSKDNPSNRFAVYDDVNANCWDIAIEYSDKAPEYFVLKDTSFEIVGARAICKQQYIYQNSTLTAEMTLSHGGKSLEVRLFVDWQENQKMLRTNLVAGVYSDHASFEIQYGKINRPNNDNTLWQKAQFEVCAHKWVDLSQPDYGVALLNDCKYGYRVYDNIIDMNLLRSQDYPGEQADRGTHTIRYAFYPHIGDESRGDVSMMAYRFNQPLSIVSGKGSGNINTVDSSFISATGGVVVEAVKPAEDGKGIIIRIYEPYGRTANATLTLNNQYSKISECNLLEETIKEMSSGNIISKTCSPFEIVTFRVEQN